MYKKNISRLVLLLILTFATAVFADYCSGMLSNAMDAYCGGNYIAAEFWLEAFLDYC